MTNKNYISYILNVLFIGIIVYLVFFNEPHTNNNIKMYEDRIDSLNNVISLNNKKLDSLSNLEEKQIDNIKDLKDELSKISNKNKDLKKKYDQEVARYNAMSNDDIANLFTETFQ